jgi:hypothetical protein
MVHLILLDLVKILLRKLLGALTVFRWRIVMKKVKIKLEVAN